MTIAKRLEGMSNQDIMYDHERRIGQVEGKIPGMVQTFELMTTSFDDLKNVVVRGNAEQLKFMQSVIKHDQGIESTRIEFEQKLRTIKLEAQERQIEEVKEKARHEREERLLKEQQDMVREQSEIDQKKENRALIRSGITKFAVWFAPVITALVSLLISYLNGYFG